MANRAVISLLGSMFFFLNQLAITSENILLQALEVQQWKAVPILCMIAHHTWRQTKASFQWRPSQEGEIKWPPVRTSSGSTALEGHEYFLLFATQLPAPRQTLVNLC